jgi:hypothetical protein
MLQGLWLATLAVIAGGALFAYSRTRDPFHPAIIVALPLAFVYGAWPFLLNQDHALVYLIGEEQLAYVGGLYLSAMLAFYLGLLRPPHRRTLRFLRYQQGFRANPFTLNLSPTYRKRLFYVALILGALGLLGYAYSINNVGGLIAAYSRAKGGGYAGSGYIGEAVLLAFPAILLLGLARQGVGKVRSIDVMLALLMAMPHLLQGTLGGRRGPLFLVLTVLFVSWFLARGKMPSLKLTLIGLGITGMLVMLVASQRQHLYLGSGGEFDAERVADVYLATETLKTNDYVAGVSSVLVSEYYQDFTWGRDHLVTLLVRPIPQQLWPSKYEVATNLLGYRVVEGGGSWEHFYEVLGFNPPKGSSVGFVANLYGSFAWGALLAIFLFGWGLALLWKRHRLRGGFWTVLFGEAMILSIYLPTQSFSAFYHRFLIMWAVTLVVFNVWLRERRLPSAMDYRR